MNSCAPTSPRNEFSFRNFYDMPMNRFVIFLLAAFLNAAQLIAAEAAPAPGEDIFAATAPVLQIEVELSRASFRSLQNDARKSVPAIVREGGVTYTNVLVHVKGAAGSFREIDSGNPSLTLNFGKSNSTQLFHGLRKIHLNNSVQDPSLTTYRMCSQLFNDAGIPAARVTNARFKLNGRDCGFYVVVEGFNKDFLKRHFKDGKGNFYDGGFLQDINQPLEKDSGDERKDQPDLKALVEACYVPDRGLRWAAMQKYLDTDRFLTFMALEVILWDWDGYVMKHNNYRIYHDPTTDKLVFLPHGMDQMLENTGGSIYRFPTDGLVARAILETPQGSQLYRERLKKIFAESFKIETITNRFDQLAKRNRDYLAGVDRGYAAHVNRAMANTRNRFVDRWQSVKDQIENEPKPLDFSKPVKITRWRQGQEFGNARHDQPELEGAPALHIVAQGDTSASWRSSVTLEPGRYRFSADVRVANVAPLRDQRGDGAGLRISGSTRRNKISGTAPWTPMQYDFETDGGETTLICELRASKGEAWFNLQTLSIEKLP
jgi:hypothetical protein